MPTGVYKHKSHQGFQKGHPTYYVTPKGVRRGRRVSDVVTCCSFCQKEFLSHPAFKRKLCSRDCLFRYRATPHWRKLQSERQKGNKGNNWQGGKTEEHKLIRNSSQIKEWRRLVFLRDNYTCQACGQYGGTLNADHELPFAEYPDLRLEVLNGRTLCVSCHKKTHSYGRKRFV